ncbi:MAG: polysaccharide biosynthesis tyrosine autokinase [candidate division NC10 bacterium]|nr:polysaccharide biosynthesis tyrosine autokinase [candidate division NC10 bacterium]
MAQYEINLRDYWRIIRRRKLIVIAVPLAFAVFSAGLAELQRPNPVFQAVASVRVEKASSLTGLLVEAITFSSGDNLATQAALIRSFPVMERAAKKLGRIRADLSSREVRNAPPHLQVIAHFQEAVKAEQEGSTNIINITATAPEAEQAARTANAVAEAFREENIATRTKQVREARLFIEEQLTEVGARLRDSEEELKTLKERRRFVSLPEETSAALNQLVALQLEREALLVDLLPAHPQVQALETRIEGVRRVLEQRQRELPETALQFARLQREVKVHEDLYALLKGKHQEAMIREREQVEEVSIVRPATAPPRPSNLPQTAAKTLVGLVVGLTLGLVLAFVVETMDTSIGTIEDVEAYLQAPVLGLIPNIDVAKEIQEGGEVDPKAIDEGVVERYAFLVSLLLPRSTIAEAYRSLRTNLEFLRLEKDLKTIVVTSASLSEGKTTTAINLAISMAQMGRRILLVEADLRRPYIHHAFGIPKDPGLAEVIIGTYQWTDVLRTATDLMLGKLGLEKVVTAPGIDNLHILTSGNPPPNPAEFLNSQQMAELIRAFRDAYDAVIFDCSPVLPVTDALILAAKTDGCLIIYRVGRVARAALRRVKTLMENVRVRVLGVVLTGLRSEVSSDYQDMEYYRYAYRGEPGPRGEAPRRPVARAERVKGWLKTLGQAPGKLKRTLLLVVLGVLLAAALLAWREGLLFAPNPPTRPAERLQERLRRPTPPEPPAPPAERPLAPKGETGPAPAAPQPSGGNPSPATQTQTRDALPPRAAQMPSPIPQAAKPARPLETSPAPPAPAPAGPAAGAAARPAEGLPPPLAQIRPVPPAPRAAPAPPTAEAVQPAPGGADRPETTAGPAPFALQVSSFEAPAKALKETRRLRAAGHPAFTLPTVSPEGLKVRRVYLGRYRSAAEARVAAAALKAQTVVEDFAVHRLPFALELTPPDEPEAARALREKCEALGYLPEEVGEGADRRWLLQAFRTRQEGAAVAAALAAYGAAAVVER